MDPNVVYHKLLEAGSDWADKNGAARMLEETRRSVRSAIAVQHMDDGASAAKAEMLAEADDKYRGHVHAMVRARIEADRARARYDSLRALADMRRTQEATRREEARLAGTQR